MGTCIEWREAGFEAQFLVFADAMNRVPTRKLFLSGDAIHGIRRSKIDFTLFD